MMRTHDGDVSSGSMMGTNSGANMMVVYDGDV